MDTSPNTVIVGAGHAGLAMSRCLQRAGVAHLVVERDTVGASWRRRWDSFHLNTPNGINQLPDAPPTGDSGAFMTRDAWIAALEAYRTTHGLPIRDGVEVCAVRPSQSGYSIETSDGTLQADNVVLCSGDQNVPRVPALASALPEDIEQLHSDRYRSPAQLPPGAVLVVGSGQTGTQLVEDLRQSGREVYLCTSAVSRPPRRYRGRDITDWIQLAGMAEQGPGDVPDEERRAPQGMISGTGGGHSISLHLLAHAGANVLGRLASVEGRSLRIADDLLSNVAVGDAAVAKLRGAIDGLIDQAGIDAPAPEPDPADRPFAGMQDMAAVRSLDLDASNVRSVIWATGYGGDFSYLPDEWLDDRGLPRHVDGVCQPGLYCLGLMWLRRRISGLIAGAAADAEHIAAQIAGRA